MICSAVAFHTNGFGSVFQCSAHSVIAAVRSATLVNTPRRSRLSFSSLNQRSIRLSQVCQCPRGDLNPHALSRALAPQASASTYSATRTCGCSPRGAPTNYSNLRAFRRRVPPGRLRAH